jgi:hypothetical protein
MSSFKAEDIRPIPGYEWLEKTSVRAAVVDRLNYISEITGGTADAFIRELLTRPGVVTTDHEAFFVRVGRNREEAVEALQDTCAALHCGFEVIGESKQFKSIHVRIFGVGDDPNLQLIPNLVAAVCCKCVPTMYRKPVSVPNYPLYHAGSGEVFGSISELPEPSSVVTDSQRAYEKLIRGKQLILDNAAKGRSTIANISLETHELGIVAPLWNGERV